MFQINIAPTIFSDNPNFRNASATLRLIDSLCFSVNVNAIIISGSSPWDIKYAILYAKVLDFPEPAQARHNMFLESSITAAYCSSVKFKCKNFFCSHKLFSPFSTAYYFYTSLLSYITISKNCLFHNLHTLIRMFLYIFTPEPDYSPALKVQFLIYLIIPLFVAGYLTNPVLTIVTLFQVSFF